MKSECVLPEMDVVEAPKTQWFSEQIGRPLVFFDIEHTGGKTEERGITELACLVVTPGGVEVGIQTLINPGAEVSFNPWVTKITGISPSKVAHSPRWTDACAPFVFSHEYSVWCGFNSRSCDVPVIQREHARFGLRVPTFDHQIDLMRLLRMEGESGSLSELVKRHVPEATFKAHRAMADAYMTLALFEQFAQRLESRLRQDKSLGFSAYFDPMHAEWCHAKDSQALDLVGYLFEMEEAGIDQIAHQVEQSPFVVARHLVALGLLEWSEVHKYTSAHLVQDA